VATLFIVFTDFLEFCAFIKVIVLLLSLKINFVLRAKELGCRRGTARNTDYGKHDNCTLRGERMGDANGACVQTDTPEGSTNSLRPGSTFPILDCLV